MGDIDLSCMGRRGQWLHPDDELAQSVLLASVRACSCRVSAEWPIGPSPIEGLAGSWIGLSLGPEGEIFCSRVTWRSLRPFDVSGHACCEEYPNLSFPGNLRRSRGFSGKQRVYRVSLVRRTEGS